MHSLLSFRQYAKKLNQQAHTALLQMQLYQCWSCLAASQECSASIVVDLQRPVQGKLCCWGIFSPRNWGRESRLSYVNENKSCGGRLKTWDITSSQWKWKCCCKGTDDDVQDFLKYRKQRTLADMGIVIKTNEKIKNQNYYTVSHHKK